MTVLQSECTGLVIGSGDRASAHLCGQTWVGCQLPKESLLAAWCAVLSQGALLARDVFLEQHWPFF